MHSGYCCTNVLHCTLIETIRVGVAEVEIETETGSVGGERRERMARISLRSERRVWDGLIAFP